jgi:hypothetical protein
MDASAVPEFVGNEHSSTADRFYNSIDMELMKEELRKFKRPEIVNANNNVARK